MSYPRLLLLAYPTALQLVLFEFYRSDKLEYFALGAVFVALSIVVSASFVLARGRDFEWSSLEQVRQERHQHIAWTHTRIQI